MLQLGGVDNVLHVEVFFQLVQNLELVLNRQDLALQLVKGIPKLVGDGGIDDVEQVVLKHGFLVQELV
jgi:hypothetical protein